jgi:UDPglucose--hexose-1-phosphate uridylyltransferase
MSEETSRLIQDDSTGDWVVVAPKRRQRPDVGGKKISASADHFSVQSLKSQKILATYGSGKNRIVAIENAFPTFEQQGGVRGYQELLIEGKEIGRFADYTVARILNVLRAYAERARVFRAMDGLKCLMTFKNEGVAAGASQPHAHSQLFGLSFVPERLQHISDARKKAEKKHRLTAHELAIREASSERTIFFDAHVTAFAHPAARFPYEVRVLTKRHTDNVTMLTDDELKSVAKALHAVLPFVRTRKLAFNYYFHDIFGDAHEHFEIRFVPRGVGIQGGFELDAGVSINPIPAEQAAAEYRNART